jgi:GTP cyclohydrolase I
MHKANGNHPLDEEKRSSMKTQISDKFREILEVLEFDLKDPQIEDTPRRIAKMFVDEIFQGCYTERPAVTTFPKIETSKAPVFLGPIELKSTCSHHFMPFFGKVWVSYLPDKEVVGISKISRIVDWFARRPQIQEELAVQLLQEFQKVLKTSSVMVHIRATHTCMTLRGVEESHDCNMQTTEVAGVFNQSDYARSFFENVSISQS